MTGTWRFDFDSRKRIPREKHFRTVIAFVPEFELILLFTVGGDLVSKSFMLLYSDMWRKNMCRFF